VTYYLWYDNQFNNLCSNVKQIPRVLIKKTIIISTIKKKLLWASNKKKSPNNKETIHDIDAYQPFL
jgi:hypothetical protein